MIMQLDALLIFRGAKFPFLVLEIADLETRNYVNSSPLQASTYLCRADDPEYIIQSEIAIN